MAGGGGGFETDPFLETLSLPSFPLVSLRERIAGTVGPLREVEGRMLLPDWDTTVAADQN